MFSHLCRVCLIQFNDPSECVPLFEEYENVFYYRICNELQILVHHNDDLGCNVCKICSENIMKFYDFLSMYKESDRKLREMLRLNLDPDGTIERKLNIVELEQNSSTLKNVVYTEEANDSVEIDNIKTEISMDYIVDTKQFIATVPIADPIQVKWKCKKCLLEFKSHEQLNSHNKIHLLKKSKVQMPEELQCTNSLERTSSHHLVKKHRREKHLQKSKVKKSNKDTQDWGDKVYGCDFCDKTFDSKNKIKQHVITHVNEGRRKFLCVSCGQQFCSKFGLGQHIRAIHDKEQRFQCKICERRFAHKHNLKTHMNRHEGVRPYPCTLCKKAFYDSSTLNVHTKSVHSNSNSYVCNICFKTFNRNGNLKIHMVRTHNLQPPKPHGSIKRVIVSSSSK